MIIDSRSRGRHLHEIKSKGVHFPGRDAPDKISGGPANRQSPAIPRKFVALYHRNTKIRMRSDEREKDLEEITADLSLRRNNLYQSLGYYRPVCLYFCVQQNSGASHPHCTSLKMHKPSGIHSMNVSGDPTPVIIDQVREIRFQRQANCIFLRVLTLW